jgi:hypothetical protein
MIQVTLDGDMLTWDSRLVPTEPGVQRLPEYGGFTVTAKGCVRCTSRAHSPIRSTRTTRTSATGRPTRPLTTIEPAAGYQSKTTGTL